VGFNRALFAVATGVSLLSAAGCHHQPATEEPPSPEAKAYVSNLKLTGVSLKATENYAGGVVTEIEGKITNTGNKTVDYAAVACVFRDSLNQLVLRERVAIVKTPLKPGETRSFRLPFDSIPESWNNQMPTIVIAQIRLS
jgi:hypothetical protein